jgi:chitin disaccharide deacetylase
MLIVNADDFGRSLGVNRGVAIAHEEGIVTSASLMVRRPAVEEAATYARQHPNLSVGLHVDLGEWVYLNGAWEAVDVVPGPVEEELRRQVASFRKLVGHEPTHLDSHQHVHRQDEVGAAFAVVAQELEVPLRACNPRIRFCGDFFGQTGKGEPLPQAISVESLLNLLADLPVGVTELGCHPGVGTDDDFPYGAERSVEVRTLCDPRIRAALSFHGIDLRSHGQLQI